MFPSQIRVEGHHKHATWKRRKVMHAAFSIDLSGQSKRSDFSERDRDDRCPFHQTNGAIMMRADVVAECPVVPIHQDPIQPLVDRLAALGKGWLQDHWSRKGLIDPPRVMVVSVIRLLPTRGLHKATVDHDLMLRQRMEAPQGFEKLRIWNDFQRQECRLKKRGHRPDQQSPTGCGEHLSTPWPPSK